MDDGASLPNGQPSIVCILRDLGNYEFTRLLTKSFEILTRLYTPYESLFAAASAGMILTVPESVAFADLVQVSVTV